MSSCASVNDRIHWSSSNNFVVGSFSFFRNMSSVLRKIRQSSDKSAVAHLFVRMSSLRNRRFLWPAFAKAAPWCSCLFLWGLVHPWASLTCGSDAIPVLLRPCSHCTSRCLVPAFSPTRAAGTHSVLWDDRSQKSLASRLWNKSSDSLLSPALPHPRGPFTALLMDPLAVRAQALLPRSSSVRGCTVPFFSCEEVLIAAVPEFFQRVRELRPLPNAATAVLFPRVCRSPSRFLQATGDNDASTGRPTTGDHGSFKASAHDGHCRGSAEVGEQLPV